MTYQFQFRFHTTSSSPRSKIPNTRMNCSGRWPVLFFWEFMHSSLSSFRCVYFIVTKHERFGTGLISAHSIHIHGRIDNEWRSRRLFLIADQETHCVSISTVTQKTIWFRYHDCRDLMWVKQYCRYFDREETSPAACSVLLSQQPPVAMAVIIWYSNRPY